jgi:hypothetical protein
MAEAHVNFKFKIESKPEGGFVARSENPTLNVEGATKEEVEARMLEKIGDLAGPQIASLIKNIQPEDLKPGAKPGIHIEKHFSLNIQTKKRDVPGPPQLADGSATQSERPISAAVWYALVIALVLLAAWWATHRA